MGVWKEVSMNMASSSDDPLELGGLDPREIQKGIDARDKKTKIPNELELQKEARLAEKEKRLTSGVPTSSKKPTPQAPPSAPAPPPVDKSLLLDKIAAYRERFPHIKKRNTVSAKSTAEEIYDELHYIELQLGGNNSTGNFGATILYSGMVGIEKFTNDYWNPLGLNLNGLGTVAQQNMHEFQPILDELMIKHGAGMYTSPEWRLALAIGATVITVHSANSNPEVARAVKQMNQQVNKKADDL